MVKVCFFCSSKDSIKEKFYVQIIELLNLLKTCDKIEKVIYGGGSIGIMGLVRETFSDKIISHNLEKWKEFEDENIHPNIMERQKALILDSDIFIILPGGVGTISELFDCIMMNDVNSFSKPVIIYNCNNYWTKLYNVIQEIVESGASKPQKMLYITDNSKEIFDLING